MTELEIVSGHSRDQVEIVPRALEHGIVLVVSGEIDLATAPAIERELLRAEESHDLVALDPSKISFRDSTGLHAIIAANLRLRARGGRLLAASQRPIRAHRPERAPLEGELRSRHCPRRN
jgi:anti-sigma B factor antagonist